MSAVICICTSVSMHGFSYSSKTKFGLGGSRMNVKTYNILSRYFEDASFVQKPSMYAMCKWYKWGMKVLYYLISVLI